MFGHQYRNFESNWISFAFQALKPKRYFHSKDSSVGGYVLQCDFTRVCFKDCFPTEQYTERHAHMPSRVTREAFGRPKTIAVRYRITPLLFSPLPRCTRWARAEERATIPVTLLIVVGCLASSCMYFFSVFLFFLFYPRLLFVKRQYVFSRLYESARTFDCLCVQYEVLTVCILDRSLGKKKLKVKKRKPDALPDGWPAVDRYIQ